MTTATRHQTPPQTFDLQTLLGALLGFATGVGIAFALWNLI